MSPMKLAMFPILFFFLVDRTVIVDGGQIWQNSNFEYPLDIAVVLDDSNSVKDTDFEQMLNFTRRIPDYFRIGTNYSRIAVVSFSDDSRFLLRTHNETTLRTKDFQRSHGNATRTDKALFNVRQSVFTSKRQGIVRNKIVILITNNKPDEFTETEEEAKKLRKDGVLIFVVFVGPCCSMESIATDRSHFFAIDQFSDLATDYILVRIQKSIRDHVCRFEESCRFVDEDRNSCEPVWFQNTSRQSARCPYPDDRPENRCDQKNCSEICDRLWPWTNYTCKPEGGREKIGRSGYLPEEHRSIINFCPRQKSMCDEKKSKSDMPPWLIAVIVVLLAIIAIAVVLLIVVVRIRYRQGSSRGSKDSQRWSEKCDKLLLKQEKKPKVIVACPVIPTQTTSVETPYKPSDGSSVEQSLNVSIASEKSSKKGLNENRPNQSTIKSKSTASKSIVAKKNTE